MANGKPEKSKSLVSWIWDAAYRPSEAVTSEGNPRLKGVLPKDYARPGLDKHRLGELIDLIATIELARRPGAPTRRDGAESPGEGTGPTSHRSVDILGRVYEYFLTMFASAEGKNGGQFYTPSCVVRCLVEPVPVRKDLAPYKGRIYDPACGSGGMFVQSEKFVESHGGVAKCEVRSARVEVKTLRPFVIRNSSFAISRADIGKEHADTFRRVQHPDLRADWRIASAEVRMWN